MSTTKIPHIYWYKKQNNGSGFMALILLVRKGGNMGNSFRQYLNEGGGGRDEDAEAFRRSRSTSSLQDQDQDQGCREESISYEEGSRLDRGLDRNVEVLEDEPPIRVNKKGKSLLLHNMISAMLAGGAKQLYIFCRRMIQH
jgi:hypothetical protein